MKNVVILSTLLSPFRSGAEACAEEVAVELSDKFNITIITAKLKPGLKRRDTLRGKVPVIRVGIGCMLDKWLFPFLAPFAARRLKPDVIHAILESYAGAALMACKWLTKAKRILTCQSTNTSLLVGSMHRSADAVTCISTALQERAKKFGTEAKLIPNGLHLSDVPEKDKVLGRILFAGRLEKMKGVDTLLMAMTTLPSQTHLHVVGDGSLRAQLELRAEKLDLSDRVTFLGFIPVPDVYKEFAHADIFCGLSRSESFGNVFVEAQAAGCAVIGTNIGGIPDIISHGKTGLLVAPDDPEAASKAISSLLDDASLKKRLVEAGKENAKKYDWKEIAEEYAKIYTTIDN